MRRLKQLHDVFRALWIAEGLRHHDAWTREQLAIHQHEKLTALVRHAVAHSPFYCELYRGLPLTDIRLRDLPITNKRLLMDNFDAVMTDRRLKLERLREILPTTSQDDYHLGRYRVVVTTGTSGLRGIFVYDRKAWSTVLANTIRWNRFVGIVPRWPRRVRICSIGADNPLHVSQRIPTSGNVGLFKVLHLEVTRPLSELVEALNAFQPQVIMPYPSVAALLADEQMAGRLRIRPQVVTTHSEVLAEQMSRRIEAAWGIPPFNHYGLTEEPHVACDCREHRGLHIFEDLCIVEIVDQDNRPVPPGANGSKYLLTNLYNGSQPLIRYEVTDMLTRSGDLCPCGRPFGLITQIGGRSEDVLVLKDDRGRDVAIPPMTLAIRIETFPDIVEYDIRHSPRAIDLRVVARSGAERNALRAALAEELRAVVRRMGATLPPVQVEFVEELPRERARMGKVKLVGEACD